MPRPQHLALLLAMTTLACTPTQESDDLRVEPPEHPSEDEATPQWRPNEPTDKLGDALTQQDVRGCHSDADCVVSCRRDGDCCGDLCTCQQVYNTGFAKELERFQAASCQDARCPKAKCKPPREVSAVCSNGLCELNPSSD